jgi:hypothetical protein
MTTTTLSALIAQTYHQAQTTHGNRAVIFSVMKTFTSVEAPTAACSASNHHAHLANMHPSALIRSTTLSAQHAPTNLQQASSIGPANATTPVSTELISPTTSAFSALQEPTSYHPLQAVPPAIPPCVPVANTEHSASLAQHRMLNVPSARTLLEGGHSAGPHSVILSARTKPSSIGPTAPHALHNVQKAALSAQCATPQPILSAQDATYAPSHQDHSTGQMAATSSAWKDWSGMAHTVLTEPQQTW